MHETRNAEPRSIPRLRPLADDDLAGQSTMRLLITAPAPAAVESLARRIHGASARAGFPFVRMRAEDLPTEPQKLLEVCSDLLDAAEGGSVLLTDIEQMPSPVQERWIELIADLEAARSPSAAVRFISGTTVPLLDRIAAGTFSERLFYRLNITHLMDT